jgi:hypothetical protein
MLMLFFMFTGSAFAKIYHCKNQDGTTSYQEHSCKNKTVKTLGENKARTASKEQIIYALSKLTGKTKDELNSPKYRAAAEALVVTDVSKAYAYSLVHAAPLKYCDQSVSKSLSNYKLVAKDAIVLGKHYYSEGIDLKVGGKQFSHSGPELTSALQDMINKKSRLYASMNKAQIKSLCSQTKQALDLLSKTYEH